VCLYLLQGFENLRYSRLSVQAPNFL